jgi:hypothetical protein
VKEVHDIILKHVDLREYVHHRMFFRFILDGKGPRAMTLDPPDGGVIVTSIAVDQRPIQTRVDRWFGWFIPFVHWRITRYIRKIGTLVMTLRTDDTLQLQSPAMMLSNAFGESRMASPMHFREPVTIRLEWRGRLSAEVVVFLDGMRLA